MSHKCSCSTWSWWMELDSQSDRPMHTAEARAFTIKIRWFPEFPSVFMVNLIAFITGPTLVILWWISINLDMAVPMVILDWASRAWITSNMGPKLWLSVQNGLAASQNWCVSTMDPICVILSCILANFGTIADLMAPMVWVPRALIAFNVGQNCDFPRVQNCLDEPHDGTFELIWTELFRWMVRVYDFALVDPMMPHVFAGAAGIASPTIPSEKEVTRWNWWGLAASIQLKINGSVDLCRFKNAIM